MLASSLDYPLANLGHPSLRDKNAMKRNDTWHARVDDGFRFILELMNRSPASGARWKSQICVMKTMRLSIVQEEIARTIPAKVV